MGEKELRNASSDRPRRAISNGHDVGLPPSYSLVGWATQPSGRFALVPMGLSLNDLHDPESTRSSGLFSLDIIFKRFKA